MFQLPESNRQTRGKYRAQRPMDSGRYILCSSYNDDGHSHEVDVQADARNVAKVFQKSDGNCRAELAKQSISCEIF